MVPHQTNDFDSRQPNASGNLALSNFDVYSNRRERIGTVIDGLQDAAGNLQSLVIMLTIWSPGKQILVPINQAQVDLQNQRFYIAGLSQQQAIAAPAYNAPPVAKPQPQQPPKRVYKMRSLEDSAPLESAAPLEGYAVSNAPIPPLTPGETSPPVVNPGSVYQSPPASPHPVTHTPIPPVAHAPVPPYQSSPAPTSDRPHPVSSPTRMPVDAAQEAVIPLSEERVMVDYKKQKVGEVVVRKEIETEINEVPVQREKLIVEQVGAEPKQLAEIDLTNQEIGNLTPTQREAQLPNIPKPHP
ncbi:MAG: PRC-barrel domain-containing protein [Oscillatoriales cyanobacterium C42_A2020_001]|nr:PRC-barrel domain-containing protein [Leptolyngbyaceae cyanobacterium C42_A2020_001]